MHIPSPSRKSFLGIIAFWLILIAGMMTYYHLPLYIGTEITVKVEPIDPRDYFRGDYVALSYEFSNPDIDLFVDGKEDGNPAQKRIFYAHMQKKGDLYVARGYSESPSTGEGIVNLRGIVTNEWSGRARAEYGIESYFVPEGKGLAIERLRNQDKVTVTLAVDPFGRAMIKTLYIDGEEIDFDLIADADVQEEDPWAPRPTFENWAAVKRPLPTTVINMSYPDSWQMDEENEVLSRKEKDASIQFKVSDNRDDQLQCEIERGVPNPQYDFCGQREIGWRQYWVAEWIDEERKQKMMLVEKDATPADLPPVPEGKAPEPHQGPKLYQLHIQWPETEDKLIRPEIDQMLRSLEFSWR